MIRIETEFDGAFEIDPVQLTLHQVRGDLGAEMIPIGPAQWVADIPMGCQYRIDKLVSNRHVGYALYRMLEDRAIFLGDTQVK